jgi:hypothetical protein
MVRARHQLWVFVLIKLKKLKNSFQNHFGKYS